MARFFGTTAFKALTVCAVLAASGASLAQSVFRVTTIPEEAATEQMRKFGPIVKYLEQKLGMKVEFTPVSDYPAAVETLVNKNIEMAWLGHSGSQTSQFTHWSVMKRAIKARQR